MGEPATVVPENPTEEAIAHSVERVVELIDRSAVRMRTRQTIASTLRAYEFMRKHAPYVRPEIQAVIAVSAECGGLVTWVEDGEVVAMAAMWPTDNPNVSRERKLPSMVLDGAYVYVDWFYGTGNWHDLKGALSYGAEKFQSADFICAHDGRSRRKGNRLRGSGRLVVRKIRRPAPTINRLLELKANG